MIFYRHLDNNQLDDLPAGVFDNLRLMYELWVQLVPFATEQYSYKGRRVGQRRR